MKQGLEPMCQRDAAQIGEMDLQPAWEGQASETPLSLGLKMSAGCSCQHMPTLGGPKALTTRPCRKPLTTRPSTWHLIWEPPNRCLLQGWGSSCKCTLCRNPALVACSQILILRSSNDNLSVPVWDEQAKQHHSGQGELGQPSHASQSKSCQAMPVNPGPAHIPFFRVGPR